MKPPPNPRRTTVAEELPRLGHPGSRSAELHLIEGPALIDATVPYHTHFHRWVGTLGATLIGIGGMGGGALPVVDNPWFQYPLGAAMGRMMLASNAVVMVGVGCLVTAWLALGRGVTRLPTRLLWATLVAWVVPLLVTAPLFTQDIYSYLANGSIVRQGMDPYSAGPVELLGAQNHLARSVPFIWAESPSPYGPVALGIAAAISALTNDSILWGVLAHRVVSVTGIFVAAGAITALARRCGVHPSAALWLGVLNPLTILHLVGGIHNEAIMLALVLAGLEVGLRGIDCLEEGAKPKGWALFLLSSVLLSCAGMVKVTGFIGLGFTGMALARWLTTRESRPVAAIAEAAALQLAALVGASLVVAAATGIGFGWVTGQGGAAQIRSWLSLTTDIGVASGAFGMWLGLGDHTDAILAVTRTAGVVAAAAFLVRMLWATFRGTIHPVGGLGVGTLVLVILFPVVQPWYPLWAILPLAAWANRPFFRIGAAAYSAVFSFLVLPRGLGLPPASVVTIYATAALAFVVLSAIGAVVLKRIDLRRGLESPA